MIKNIILLRFIKIIILLVLISCRSGFAQFAPSLESPVIFPDNAYYLPISEKAALQEALDAHKIVVLQKGDYAIPNTNITLKSGYQLYGDPAGTSLPGVVVAPGTTGALLSTVIVKEGVSFPASSEITRANLITRLIGPVKVHGGSLEDNLFLHIDGKIHIDNSQGGFMRNNRFIRCKTHAVWPQLVMLGDSERTSSGNVFLWYNFLTPHGDATNIINQKDLTFVGFDAETWNQYDRGTNALIKVDSSGRLVVFGANGGNHGAYPTPVFDVSAEEFLIYNNLMEKSRSGVNDYVYRQANLRSLEMNSSNIRTTTDEADEPFRIKAFEAGSQNLLVNGTTQNNLPPDQQSLLSSMITENRTGNPWETPLHNAVPDPAGSSWNSNLEGKTDHADSIQALIDRDGVARLPAGLYYISRPLKIGINQGIIGAGADKTAIIALDPSIDMIVANDKDPKAPTGRKIFLSGLTLQGGKNGIHFEPEGTGTLTADGDQIQALNPDGSPKVKSNGDPVYVKAQYTAGYFNDLTFRNMTVAGIFMDQIYALDNIFVSYANFVNCDVGWKQKVDPEYVSPGVSGETSTMMYMDKVMLYRCQFAGNRLAMELPGNRGCNLNAWVNCNFVNNREGVAVMNSYLSPLFANCDFINNGGNAVVISNRPVSFVACRFKAGQNGISMFGGSVSAEGCSFIRDGSENASILGTGDFNGKIFFTNCISRNMPLGLSSNTSGMLINSEMDTSDQVNRKMVLISNGATQALLDEPTDGTNPETQLLFGNDWSDELNYYSMQIALLDSATGESLAGFDIELDWKKYTTNEQGIIQIPELREGSYNMALLDERYVITGDKIIKVHSDTLVSVNVKKLPAYFIQFDFKDSVSGLPLDSINVIFNKQEFATDANGSVFISDLLKGNYKMEISDNRFRLVGSNIFGIHSDTLIHVSLVKIPNLTIQVINRTDNTPVYRAVVLIDENRYHSNSSGEVIANNYPPGNVIISASHRDYFTEIDTLSFFGDTIFFLLLTPLRSNVTFQVSDFNGPVSGAKVNMADSQITDSGGRVYFFYQPSRENYAFSVEMEGYLRVQDTFYLQTDTIIEVILQKTTLNQVKNFQDFSIRPNPFNAYIELDIPMNGVLHIYDISGIRRASHHVNEGTNIIFTDKLGKGSYILKFVAGEITYNRLIIN